MVNMVSKKSVFTVLKKCFDPEIPVNIVDLGLIRNVEIKKNEVKIKMSLTSPFCPMQTHIVEDVKEKISKIKGVKKVEVEVVPWSPKNSKSGRKKLG